jgi:hypothetical protein
VSFLDQCRPQIPHLVTFKIVLKSFQTLRVIVRRSVRWTVRWCARETVEQFNGHYVRDDDGYQTVRRTVGQATRVSVPLMVPIRKDYHVT